LLDNFHDAILININYRYLTTMNKMIVI